MDLSQQILAVVLVLGLLLAVAVLFERRGWIHLNWRAGSRSSRAIELIDRLPLSPQHQLHLVRISGKTILIATHARGVELLDSAIASEPTRLLSKGSDA